MRRKRSPRSSGKCSRKYRAPQVTARLRSTGRKFYFSIHHSCRDWFIIAIFCNGVVLLIRTGSANCGIRFEFTFILFEPKIIRTASANSLSGFCFRSHENSGSSGISSTLDSKKTVSYSDALHRKNASCRTLSPAAVQLRKLKVRKR